MDEGSIPDPVACFLPDGPKRTIGPLLPAIAAQAVHADRTRNISEELITALKDSNIMRLSATRKIGGLESSVLQIGRELEAIAANYTSTAWVMWNHLAVFHLFAGTLGPDQAELLERNVARHEWV